ncbi:MAG: hypothetical protein ACTH4Y_11560 [Microbacterium gubbeenense]|uniref:hypothetical protein n=1 Tax=Microbacterium gubbeenense TaxID=159896 RepID=UPI003F970BB9
MSTNLTPYDTGMKLEPFKHDVESNQATGKVDFDDNFGDTLLTVHVERHLNPDGLPSGFYIINLAGDNGKFLIAWDEE